MKGESFLGGYLSVVTQAAELTNETMRALDKNLQKASKAIERIKVAWEHCYAVQSYFSSEKILLEFTVQQAKQFISTEEQMADPDFKKIFLKYHELLNPGEPYLSFPQNLSKLYSSIEYFNEIKLQHIPKPLPVDDIQISMSISERFNILLDEHIGNLKHIKQALDQDKKLAEAMKKALEENGLLLLWGKLMAS